MPKIAGYEVKFDTTTVKLGIELFDRLFHLFDDPWLDPVAEFSMAARDGGRSYTQLIGEIVELAMKR